MTSLFNNKLRGGVVLAGLIAAAALAPTAGATGCSMSEGADCQGMDMKEMVGGMSMAGMDMSGSDMRGADMRGMDLRGVDFTDADLRGAKMQGAKMDRMDMTGADMRGMKLSNMTMKGVTLDKADMRGARLRNVMITGSSVVGTDLRGATMTGGGMKNSMISGMKAGSKGSTSGKQGAASRSALPGACSGVSTVFRGSAVNTYNFDNSWIDWGNYRCATFDKVSWRDVTITNSDFSYTYYNRNQNYSETIIVADTSFVGADFNSSWWAPAQAFRVRLANASCDEVNYDNRVWGRYNFGSGNWDRKKKQYGFGTLTSVAYGSPTFADQPRPIWLTQDRLNIRNAQKDANGGRPYFSPFPFSDCVAQTGSDGAY